MKQTATRFFASRTYGTRYRPVRRNPKSSRRTRSLAPLFIFQCFTKRSESALPHRTYERVSQSAHKSAPQTPSQISPKRTSPKPPLHATTSRGTAPRSTAVHLITPHLPRALCRFRPHLPRFLAVTIATPSQQALRTQARCAVDRSRRRRGIRRRASREGNGVRGRGFGEVETEFGKTE